MVTREIIMKKKRGWLSYAPGYGKAQKRKDEREKQ
jgi:hypothetical protein